MSIVNVRFSSTALGKKATFNVIHPDHGDGPFPVLLQLHGYSDDCNDWLYNSNLVRHVDGLPMIVVLPDGGTSRYLNLKAFGRHGLQHYEDLIMTDIPNEVQRMFRVRGGRWAIGGLSMGGFGALRLGMKYPDRFASIWAHSAGLRQLEDVVLEALEDPADAQVETHAERLAGRTDAPRISFDCGVDDFLIEHNRAFHAYLDRIGLAHHYAEHPGAHTWGYWDQHVVAAIAQHTEVFGIARAAGQ